MRTLADRWRRRRSAERTSGPWRSIPGVIALTVAGAVIVGMFLRLPPNHAARIGRCVDTGTGSDTSGTPPALRVVPCSDATADARIIGLAFSFLPVGLSQPECNHETDVVIEVRFSLVACARNLDRRPSDALRHPGDAGHGGGIVRPGDCLEETFTFRERPCSDPAGDLMLLAWVDVPERCPPATRVFDTLEGRRHPVACLGPKGPASAAQVVAPEPVCPGCASGRDPVPIAVASVVGLAGTISVLNVIAQRASAQARRRSGVLTFDALSRAADPTMWWQWWGLALRLTTSAALVLSGLGTITFLQLANIANGPLTGDRDVDAARVVFGLGALWLTAVASVLWRNGRRLSAPTATQVMRRDPRPPVLYLRSFRDDTVTSRQITPLYPMFRRYSEEDQLARALRAAGPVVAIGRPNEQLPELGAARLYAGADEWQATVTTLMGLAALVVVRGASTPGLQWELEQVLGRMPLQKLLLLIPFGIDDYQQFRAELEPNLPCELPPFASHPWADRRFASFRRITLRGAIYFTPQGSAEWVSFWWGALRIGPGRGVAQSLRRRLRPVLTAARPRG